MSDNKVPLARPDCPEALKALSGHHDHTATMWAFSSLWFTSLMALNLTLKSGPHLVRVAAWMGLVVFSLAVIGEGVLSKKHTAAYNRHVANGNIIHVHPHLFHVWDQLREEAGVALTKEEREQRLPWLFDAALDLHAELETWAQCRDEPECAERMMLAEARIRARLVREVNVIEAEQQARQQLDALAPSPNPVGVTDDDVAQQLAVLRREHDTNAQGEAGEGA